MAPSGFDGARHQDGRYWISYEYLVRFLTLSYSPFFLDDAYYYSPNFNFVLGHFQHASGCVRATQKPRNTAASQPRRGSQTWCA